jgi:hypothetical protein
MRPHAFIFAVLLCASAFFAAPAHANSLLIAPNPNQGQKFPVQGDCARNGIDPSNPPGDQTRSTWSCTGASSKMVRIFYRDGPEICVFIDNFNNDGGQSHAFFVPLQSSEEWLAFAANKPGGVNLRYGCKGIVAHNGCGDFPLPDAPASDNPADVQSFTGKGGVKVEFSCPATQDFGDISVVGGCGEWKLKNPDDCATTSILPTTTPGSGPIIPITPGSGGTVTPPTTGIPPLETPGPVIPITP